MTHFNQNRFGSILHQTSSGNPIQVRMRANSRNGGGAVSKFSGGSPLMNFKYGRTRYAEIKYIKIQVPSTIYNVGLVLQRYLEKNGYRTSIIQTITNKDAKDNWNSPNEYYILLSCGELTILPPPKKIFCV